MVKLGIGAWLPVVVKVNAFLLAQLFEAAHIANRCIQPHIKIFARRVGYLETKVRRIAGNVPV